MMIICENQSTTPEAVCPYELGKRDRWRGGAGVDGGQTRGTFVCYRGIQQRSEGILQNNKNSWREREQRGRMGNRPVQAELV